MLVVCVSPLQDIGVVGLTRRVRDEGRCLGSCLWQVVTPALVFGSGRGPEEGKQCLDQNRVLGRSKDGGVSTRNRGRGS